MPLLWLNCLDFGLLRKQRAAGESHASSKNRTFRESLKNRLVFILSDLAFVCLSNLFSKGHRGTCKDERCVQFSYHVHNTNTLPGKATHYTAQATIQCHIQFTIQMSSCNVMLSCFRIFPTCPFLQKHRKLGMWFLEAIIFLAMDCSFY